MKFSREMYVRCHETGREKYWNKIYDLEMKLDDFIEELHGGIHPLDSISVSEDTDIGMHMYDGEVSYEWIMENLWNIYGSLECIAFTFKDTEDTITVFAKSDATNDILFRTHEESLSLHEFLGVKDENL